jgi:hypothetical protein
MLIVESSQAETTISRDGGRPYTKDGPAVRLTLKQIKL